MADQIQKYDAGAISNFLRQPENVEQFTQIMGHAGKSYVQSVIIAVANNEQLMACTPPSIMRSALRAASLELSCDPSLRQAYLIPRNRKVKGTNGKPDTWVKEAQFQPHYNGLYTLAMRTGKYWVINVSPVYEGSEVYEDMLTGLHTVVLENGLMTGNEQVARLRKVSDKNGKKVIGWLGYFKTKKGSEKSAYMTVEEIEEHAAKFSDSYQSGSSLWKNQEHRPIMQMKTVLIALLKWADMSGTENSILRQAMQADTEDEGQEHAEQGDVIEGESHPVEEQSDLDKDFPPLGPDWQAAQSAKEAEKQPEPPAKMNGAPRPYSPVDFQAAIAKVLAKYTNHTATDKQRQLCAMLLDIALMDEGKDARHTLTRWLFGKPSLKDCDGGEINALLKWLDPQKDSGGGYAPGQHVTTEAKAAYVQALKDEGQQELI